MLESSSMFSMDFQRCSCDEVGIVDLSSCRTNYGQGISLQNLGCSKRFGFKMHQEGLFGMCTEIQEWDGNKHIFLQVDYSLQKYLWVWGLMVAFWEQGKLKGSHIWCSYSCLIFPLSLNAHKNFPHSTSSLQHKEISFRKTFKTFNSQQLSGLLISLPWFQWVNFSVASSDCYCAVTHLSFSLKPRYSCLNRE